MNTPNLDDMLDHLQESESGFSTKEQRAELTSLKQRCEDLELMLRLSLDYVGSSSLRRYRPNTLVFCPSIGDPIFIEDDGTGLPLLTPEAREALRKR